jgi:hypothetical protein
MPPRGKLCGLSAPRGLEWLYELDNCGDVYAVPLCSQNVGEHFSSRDAPEVAGFTRPSVWVQNVDVRPVVDNRAIVQLAMDGGGSSGEAEQTSSLEALARLNTIYARCSTRAAGATEKSTDTRAAHMEMLRLPRNVDAQQPQKRPREQTTSPPRPEGWVCRVCRRQSNDLHWSSLRNHLSFPSDASDRLCTGCAAAVEAAMRDELSRRAKTESVARKPCDSRRHRVRLCTWVQPQDRPREVPRSLREPVVAYITLSPRTLHELTAWLRLRMAVEESAVARFVQSELGALVRCTQIADRLPSGDCPAGHRTVYSLNLENVEASSEADASGRKSTTATLKTLWNSSS